MDRKSEFGSAPGLHLAAASRDEEKPLQPLMAIDLNSGTVAGRTHARVKLCFLPSLGKYLA